MKNLSLYPVTWQELHDLQFVNRNLHICITFPTIFQTVTAWKNDCYEWTVSDNTSDNLHIFEPDLDFKTSG